MSNDYKEIEQENIFKNQKRWTRTLTSLFLILTFILPIITPPHLHIYASTNSKGITFKPATKTATAIKYSNLLKQYKARAGAGGGDTDIGGNDTGTGGGWPSATSERPVGYVTSLYKLDYENEGREDLIGSIILTGYKSDPVGTYNPITDGKSYFYFDEWTLTTRPATKQDIKLGSSLIFDKVPSNTVATIANMPHIEGNDVGAINAVKWFLGSNWKPGQPGELTSSGKGFLNELISTMGSRNLLSFDVLSTNQDKVTTIEQAQEKALELMETGNLSLHVEPMAQERVKGNETPTTKKVNYTASQYVMYDKNNPDKRKFKTTGYWGDTGKTLRRFLMGSAYINAEMMGGGKMKLTNFLDPIESQTYKDAAATSSGNKASAYQYFTDYATGIYIIKLIPKEPETDFPQQDLEINIPSSDFILDKLEPAQNDNGMVVDFAKGELHLNVTGGFNGSERTPNWPGQPWEETKGKLVREFGLPLSPKQFKEVEFKCKIHKKVLLPQKQDSFNQIEQQTKVKGLAKALDDAINKVFPGGQLPQKYLNNPGVIIAPDGCRIFPTMQGELAEVMTKQLESSIPEVEEPKPPEQPSEDYDPAEAQEEYEKAVEARQKTIEGLSKFTALKLEWEDAKEFPKQILQQDERMKFQIYVMGDSQLGSGKGLASANIPITQAMQSAGISSLKADEYTKIEVKTDGNDHVVLKWDPNDPELKKAIDTSQSLIVRASINWVEPEERITHSYTSDKWLRTEDIHGWENNALEIRLKMPRPNLIAKSVTPRYDEEKGQICIEGVGVVETLPPGQNTISSDHRIQLLDKDGNIVGEKTIPFKDKPIGQPIPFPEICFDVPKPEGNKEETYYVRYKINPSEKIPENETTYKDNEVENEIIIGGEFNWKALEVSAVSVNTTPNDIEKYVYKVVPSGRGMLEKNKLKQTPTYETTHIIRIWEKGNEASKVELEELNTPKMAEGDKVDYFTENSATFEVGRHQTKTIVLEYEINPTQQKPDFEITYEDNVVRNEIILKGPTYTTPPPNNIPVNNLACEYPTSGDPSGNEKLDDMGSWTLSMNFREKWGYKEPKYTRPTKWASDRHDPNQTDNLGASPTPETMPGYGPMPDGIFDHIQVWKPFDVTYSYYTYTGKDQHMTPTVNTKIIPTYIKETASVNHLTDKNVLPGVGPGWIDCEGQESGYCPDLSYHHCPGHWETGEDGKQISIPCPENGHCACVKRYCTKHRGVFISEYLDTTYYYAFDQEYTDDIKNSRTYSTQAEGTKDDKIFIPGKGIKTTVRTKMVTDWIYPINYGGHFAYSVASGPNSHNQPRAGQTGEQAYLHPEFKPRTPLLEVMDRRETTNKDFINPTHTKPWDNKNHLRYTVNELEKNPLSVGQVREAYTNVNYPEAKILSNGKVAGLDTLSLFYIKSIEPPGGKIVGDITNDAGNKMGLCYKDTLIPISNYYNDYWSKVVNNSEVNKD